MRCCSIEQRCYSASPDGLVLPWVRHLCRQVDSSDVASPGACCRGRAVSSRIVVQAGSRFLADPRVSVTRHTRDTLARVLQRRDIDPGLAILASDLIVKYGADSEVRHFPQRSWMRAIVA